MSYWDGHEIVRWPPEPDGDHPGWTWLDCGCCAGVEWSAAEYPVECSRCSGGMVARHDASGALALYPGGPFTGREIAV